MFRRIDQPLMLESLEHFPDPKATRQATLNDLMAFFVPRGYHYKERIATHYEQLQGIAPEARVSEGHVIHMLSLFAILCQIEQQQRVVRKQLQARFLSRWCGNHPTGGRGSVGD